MQNHLKNQTSPYLLQHADNPVNWYPWCDEAFERAKREDKPILLSIGYSTCHWCHVMAHESFEDTQTAEILNRYFISIKVDKEERPDIDSIYMAVCQAFTGSGGWPTTIFLTPQQKPFYAGTYFPKTARYGQVGFQELLLAIQEKWATDREVLLRSAEEMVAHLNREVAAERRVSKSRAKEGHTSEGSLDAQLIDIAVDFYKRGFDKSYGGFGQAPKFPTPHNLLFLMNYYGKSRDEDSMKMVEKTLLQMYRGGIFDHIGGGFSRYSTDRYFLAPHFEKMLYDNALLILAYSQAYQIARSPIYREVAERTAAYILREMTSPEGGFYCAQDADSEGVEGKYYLFSPKEIQEILGAEMGKVFCEYFDLTEKGNFEGKNIPNLLKNQKFEDINNSTNYNEGDSIGFDVNSCRQAVYEYRKKRHSLHLDDKILTSWNGLMIAALCNLYRVTEEENYLKAAIKAQEFIEHRLCKGDVLHVSYREGKRGGIGFLDDYANEIFALLALYEATLDNKYLERAKEFCKKAMNDFYDKKQGGFFLYGKENEQLILRPKETYDGAMPSGNSVMAYNLVQLYYLTEDSYFGGIAEQQLSFMSEEAQGYPAGHAMFLLALSDYLDPPEKITIVLKEKQQLAGFPCRTSLQTLLRVMENPTKEYPLKNDKTTFYVCKGRSCQPPVNEIGEM